MFSKNLYKLVAICFGLLYYSGVSRISFDFKGKRFFIKQTKSWKNNLAISFYIFLLFFWCGNALNIIIWEGGNTHKYFYLTCAYAFVSVVEVPGLLLIRIKERDLALLMTWSLQYFKQFEVNWMPSYNPSTALASRIVDFIAFSAIFGCTGSCPSTTLHYLIFPRTPAYLPSLLPEDMEIPAWFYWISAIVVTYHSCLTWFTIMGLGVCGAISTIPMLIVLKREFRADLKRHLSIPALRTGRYFPHEYICLELVFRQMLRLAGPIILMLKDVLGKLTLFANYALIKHWSTLGKTTKVILIMWSLICQVMWSTILEIGGRFHSGSKSTIKNMKKIPGTKEDRKFMSKFKKRCRPLQMKDEGGLFRISRLSVLKFFKANVKGTFRALIALK